MSDTPRMNAAREIPIGYGAIDANRYALYREGCKLERELAAAQAEISAEKQAHNDGLREYAETIGKRKDKLTAAVRELLATIEQYENDSALIDTELEEVRQAAHRARG